MQPRCLEPRLQRTPALLSQHLGPLCCSTAFSGRHVGLQGLLLAVAGPLPPIALGLALETLLTAAAG